jgi:hypothetical protein
MARRFETKSPAKGKSRSQSKEERQQARTESVAGGTRAKAGRGKAGRGGKSARGKTGAKGAAKSENDRALESRLQRLEQEVALQAERNEELFEKVQTVIAGGHVADDGADDGTDEREDED